MTPDEPVDADLVSVTEASNFGVTDDGPLDPDSDATVEPSRTKRRWPHRRRRSHRRHADVVGVVGVGGSIGALSRYGLDRAFPVGDGHFPWTTLGINLGGCLALGVVLYILFERRPPSRLLRPFLAIGVLGGFTTFSTFAVEVVQRVNKHPSIAAVYLVASVIGGPVAVLTGSASIRRLYAKPRTPQK